MTKLSTIREEHDQRARGEWRRFGDTDICLRLRGFTNPDYQRALRVVLDGFPKLAPEATLAQKLDHDEAIGRAIVPLIAEHVVTDAWGIDADEEPVNLNGELQHEVVLGVCDGVTIERAQDPVGNEYRPIRSGALCLWQSMEQRTPQKILAILSDPRCAELLAWVRVEAALIDQAEAKREAEALGKRLRSPDGKSSTASTPKI